MLAGAGLGKPSSSPGAIPQPETRARVISWKPKWHGDRISKAQINWLPRIVGLGVGVTGRLGRYQCPLAKSPPPPIPGTAPKLRDPRRKAAWLRPSRGTEGAIRHGRRKKRVSYSLPQQCVVSPLPSLQSDLGLDLGARGLQLRRQGNPGRAVA